jgi:hypothetical protein
VTLRHLLTHLDRVYNRSLYCPSLRAGTPAVLGQMRGTLTFSTLLSSHNLIIIVNLYQWYTRAACTLVLILLTQDYFAITALFANLINHPYRVHSSVGLL